jgi:hypothetical protein
MSGPGPVHTQVTGRVDVISLCGKPVRTDQPLTQGGVESRILWRSKIPQRWPGTARRPADGAIMPPDLELISAEAAPPGGGRAGFGAHGVARVVIRLRPPR